MGFDHGVVERSEPVNEEFSELPRLRNSEISDCCRCPRLYELKSIKKLRCIYKSSTPSSLYGTYGFNYHLLIGTLTHEGIAEMYRANNLVKGLDAVDRLIFEAPDEGLSEKERFMVPKCRGIARKFVIRAFEYLTSDRLEGIEDEIIEEVIESKPYGLKFRCTPDMIATTNKGPTLYEYKTTIKADLSEYLENKLLDAQAPLYCWLYYRKTGVEIKQIIYRIFKVPSLRQKKLETDYEYSRRLSDRVLEEDSMKEMRIVVTQEMIASVRENFLGLVMMVSQFKRRGFFPQYRNACLIGRYKCDYFDLCNGPKINDKLFVPIE